VQPARPLHLIQARQLRVVEWRAGRSEMALGKMKVDRSGLEVGMPEQRLHGGQIGAPFQEVCGETVAQYVRAYRLGDSGALRRFPGKLPRAFSA
jgi:hypothetical protein